MRQSLTLLFLLFVFNSFSQTTKTEQKINSLLEDYFHFNRENIHVHFNKMIYVNNEDVAFKGYIINKQYTIPNLNTSNIQVVVYNEKQEVVQKQLLFASNGTFNSTLRLNDKFASGRYYFHFYTNFMNNFIENDSFIQTIEIIDRNESYNLKSKSPNLATASVQLFPENGIIIDGINNTIGVKITDCNQIGIQILDGFIVDSKSNEIAKFKTNQMGYGNFYFVPNIKENYFLKIATDKINISQQLPQTQASGIAISYNNNLSNDNIAINIKTNTIGLEMYKNKKFTLLIHQNKNAIQKEFSFENNEINQVIRFNKKYLSNGVNSIRIIDENLNELAERLLYYEQNPKVNISLELKNSVNDSLSLFGKTEANFANISVSVLPEENSCINQNRSILGTFYLNAYLEKPEINNSTYFDLENLSRKKELDLLLLCQEKSKYKWKNIVIGSPKIDFPYKKGVNIIGSVEKKLNPKDKFKIILFSFKDKIWEETYLDKENKFKFENFYAKDSTSLLLQLVNEKNSSYHAKIDSQIESTTTTFTLKPIFEKDNCPILKTLDSPFNFKSTAIDKNATALSEVKITNSFKKEVLTHQKDIGNSFATGYKIPDDDFGSLLLFLDSHGYRTGLDETQSVYISSRRNFGGRNELSGSPQVFIDEEKLMDFDSLFNLNMSDIDEVYIDKTGISAEGVIRIYLKKGVNKDFYNPKFSILIVSSGFSKSVEFKNTTFDNQKEFYTFGTLDWEPNLILSEKHEFEIKFPKGNQKAAQVLIEGFTPEGQFFSEAKKIKITNP